MYTDVAVRELVNKDGLEPRGAVFTLAFTPTHGVPVRVFIPVMRASPLPLVGFAQLLASVGVKEPKEGWVGALCLSLVRNSFGDVIGGTFSADHGLRAIQSCVLGKRAIVIRREDERGYSYTPGPAFGADNVVLFPGRAAP
jgi:hypothetical protein